MGMWVIDGNSIQILKAMHSLCTGIHVSVDILRFFCCTIMDPHHYKKDHILLRGSRLLRHSTSLSYPDHGFLQHHLWQGRRYTNPCALPPKSSVLKFISDPCI